MRGICLVVLLSFVALRCETVTAQTLTFGGYRAELRASEWHNDSTAVHQQAMNRINRDPKVPRLVDFARRQLGARTAQLTARGGTLRTHVDVFQPGVNVPARLTGNLTFVEIRVVGTNRTAAMGYFHLDQLPNVGFPRLLTKEFAHDSLVSERSLRLNGQITLMAARHSDAIFRSGEQILRATNPGVHRVLRARIEALRRASAIDTLVNLYGPNGQGFGGPNLALVSTLLIPANYEEEFAPRWVEGQIDGLKPLRSDSPTVRILKQALKLAVEQLVKLAGKWLASWFGM